MEINSLTKQELNAISAYLIHDKRDKSVTFNHKQMADLGLKLFNEVNNVRWDEPKNEQQALNLLAVSNSAELKKECSNCKHNGKQMIYPSACTGCGADEEYANWEHCC